MKEKDCVICSKRFSTKTNAETKSKTESKNIFERNVSQEAKEKCVTVKNQLPVMFLLRKLLNIPEEMCTKFLENNGNPVSWIFWCDTCAKLIREAEHLFKEIQELQKKLISVGSCLKKAIALSAEVEEYCGNIDVAGTLKKTTYGPAEEIRSYIIQEFRSLESSKVQIKTENYDNYDVDTEIDTDGLKCEPRSCDSRRSMKEDGNDDFSEWKSEENCEESDSSSSEETILGLKSDISKDISEEQSYKIGTKKTAKKRNVLAKCEVCFQEFSLWRSLRRHFLREHGEFPYSCDHCKRKVVSKDALENHINKLHCRKTTFLCDICNKYFSSQSILMEHREIFHGLMEKKKITKEIILKCPKCDDEYKLDRHLRNHCKQMHSEDFDKLFPENEENECKICRITFTRSSGVRDHYKLKHLEEFKIKYPGYQGPNEFKCTTPDCNYKTNVRRCYLSHLKSHLPLNERPFVCDICRETFAKKRYLECHQKSKHYEELGLNPFKCDQCGKILSSPTVLRSHIRNVHLNVFKFTCPICNKGLGTKTVYDIHMKIHEGIKGFLCAECGLAFVSQGLLNYHVRTVHRNERRFPCNQCSKAFKSPSTLRCHVEGVHSNGDNPFKCEFCPKAFPIRNYLYYHLKTHRKKNLKL